MTHEEIKQHNARARANRARKELLIARSHAKARLALAEERELRLRGFRHRAA